MKILNITIVLATMACAFAEASPLKDRTLFKRAPDTPTATDCTAVCPLYLHGITAFRDVFTLAHDGLRAQIAALPVGTITENVPIHDAVTKFVNALATAETDKFEVATSLQALADAAKELLAITRPANTLIPPNILTFIDLVFNSIKNIGGSVDAFIQAGCPTTK